PVPMIAPHLAEQQRALDPDARIHRLTIDRPLQERLEALAEERAGQIGRKISVAILVVENATGKVLAHVGSAGYLDDARAGHIDMTTAIRSPGSALKPFVYGLAFEAGRVHPETLIEDRPAWFGGYAPKNFDDDYQGTVTVRQALQMSLNVPAVALLQLVGPERLFSRLRAVGIEPKLPVAEAPGLAVGLGGVGLTLADLTRLYVGIARGGPVVPLIVRADAPRSEPADHPVLSEVASWYVADVLAGAAPPNNAAGGFAYKTGTSYGYRDAWSVGFDGAYTIAVWVGRPDGTPIPGITGRRAAAPILFDAFARLDGERVPLKARPRGAVVATTAQLPPPLRRFGGAGALVASTNANTAPLGIVFPPDGARVDLGFRGSGSAAMPLALKASGGEPPLIWLVNGKPVARSRFRRESLWQPDGPGFANLSVIDARGASSTVTVRIE
ncbi:MAG: penicillin-binding protein 1C, partial [Hyphomicrobiales bacterium]|nr:penicillin-binding protein 1C [Hyphomicrobiales bacterium]